jgi:hypothetical protein
MDLYIFSTPQTKNSFWNAYVCVYSAYKFVYVLQYVIMFVCFPGERVEYERSTYNHKGTSNLAKRINIYENNSIILIKFLPYGAFS